jgi:hypothetical protein
LHIHHFGYEIIQIPENIACLPVVAEKENAET